MLNEQKALHKNRFVGFLLALLAATIFLNLDALHYQPLQLWARLAPSLFMLVGAVGAARNVKLLTIVGWLGIAAFLIVSTAVSFPTEDYVLGGPNTSMHDVPRDVSSKLILVRVLVGMGLTLLLSHQYRRIRTHQGRQ